MKHDLTTGTWQDDTGCPISIVLVATSDVAKGQYHAETAPPSNLPLQGLSQSTMETVSTMTTATSLPPLGI